MNRLMEYRGFHAKVNYDVRNKTIVGEVFDTNDPLIFKAVSVNSLKESFHYCVDQYIEVCRKKGVNPCKEYDGIIHLTLPPEIYQKAISAAAKQKITIDQLVENAIASALQQA